MNASSNIRHHLGIGQLELRRELSVFINCPYDEGYRPLFGAIIFATLSCGFIPRSAVETGTASISRMDRIMNSMCSSKYSIHDLSRCRGEGDANLARFNMPLELGMAMALRFGIDQLEKEHDWLSLVPHNHPYRKYISDLSGFDPMEHDGTVQTIVPTVMSWLATRPEAIRTPTPTAVLQALPIFQKEREDLCSTWHGCEPWPDLLIIGLKIGRDEKLIPST